MTKRYKGLSLKNKVKLMMFIILVPLIIFICYLLSRMGSYSNYFGKVYDNIALASTFGQEFQSKYDYSINQIVIGSSSFEIERPYEQIEKVREVVIQLHNDTEVSKNKTYANQMLKNLDSLKKSTDIILKNISMPGPKYDKNVEILDNDIYTTTQLIKEKSQDYVFYESFELKEIKEKMLKETGYTLTLAIGIFIGLLIIILILLEVMSNSITNPIQELINTIKLVGEGDFTARVDISELDEITLLTASFNTMTEKVQKLIEKVKEEEIKLKQMELKLLQSQINPHFLYNTMDTIVWLATDNKNQDVINIVLAFSDFFRTSLSKGKDFISLEEEIKHIESYLTIQKFRYYDILEYKVDIPEELWSYQILKLTLQPLIENAIYHGIKNKRGKGKIIIEAKYKDEIIIFKVIDNGIGMTEEELDRLRNKLNVSQIDVGKGGFGLINVNERVKLTYGAKYQLEVNSILNKGTEMIIGIPAISYNNK